jgi:hypothetical protein
MFMKSINGKVSNEAHKNLINYKLDNNLKTIDEALDKILKKIKNAKSKNI